MMDFTNLTPTSVLGLICCGIFSLLYGVHVVTGAMASPQFRRSLVTLGQRPGVAFGLGVLVTAVTQSSGATTSLLVGLVSVRLLPLAVAIIAVLGANIGSALAVQLLAFHITHFALDFVGLGAAVALVTHRTRQREVGQICFGLGLMIFGLASLEAGGQSLAENPTTALVLAALATSPIILALSGVMLSMLFSSSVAGVGLVIVLISHESLSLEAALALLLGANVGPTVIALLTAFFRGSLTGRRLALIHVGTKLTLAGMLLGVLPLWALALNQIPLPAGTLVAIAHLSFNLALALIFVPCASFLAALVERWLPESEQKEATGPLYLHPDGLLVPAVALGQATREVLHMTDLVTVMLDLSIQAFGEHGKDIPARLAALDDQLDILNAEIKRYLTLLDENAMTEELKSRQIALLYIITDLEAMGDLLGTQCMHLAQRKIGRQLVFSEEEWQELITFHREIAVAVQQVFAALATQDTRISEAFQVRKRQLGQMKQALHLRHVRRLQSGVALSVASSALLLDLLTMLRGMLTHASTIARIVQEYLSFERETPSEQWSSTLLEPEAMPENRWTVSLRTEEKQTGELDVRSITVLGG